MCYSSSVWTVAFHPEAEAELDALPVKERIAVMHAVEKLVAVGPRCRSHTRATSKVQRSSASFGPEAVGVRGARCTDE